MDNFVYGWANIQPDEEAKMVGLSGTIPAGGLIHNTFVSVGGESLLLDDSHEFEIEVVTDGNLGGETAYLWVLVMPSGSSVPTDGTPPNPGCGFRLDSSGLWSFVSNGSSVPLYMSEQGVEGNTVRLILRYEINVNGMFTAIVSGPAGLGIRTRIFPFPGDTLYLVASQGSEDSANLNLRALKVKRQHTNPAQFPHEE